MFLNKLAENWKKVLFIPLLSMIIGTVGIALFPIVSAQSLSCTTVLSNVRITGGAATCQVVDTMCSIVNTVTLIVGIIALAMFVIGGLLYGFAHFMPAAGNLRAGMQGWGVGIIIGGVIATVIFILAPFIIGTILGNVSSTNALISAMLSGAGANSITQLCSLLTFNVP